MYDTSICPKSGDLVKDADAFKSFKSRSGSQEVRDSLVITYRSTAEIHKKLLRVGRIGMGCGACGHTSPD